MTTHRIQKDCDVVIVGGGLVGASLAVSMADSGRKVVLVERALPPHEKSTWDERCIALNDTSHCIFDRLGIWTSLTDQACPIIETHISEKKHFGVARISAAENGLEALGYNVPVRAISQALWKRIDASSVTVFCPALLTAIQPDEDGVTVKIEFGTSSSEVVLRARLVAAADGARSMVRQRLGIPTRTHDYEQQAIVSAVRISRPHRGIAYERFTPDGILAVLPKAAETCSMIWTVASRRTGDLLSMPEDTYLRQVRDVFGGRLGSFESLGRRAAFPLIRVISQNQVALRTIFLGNAAQNLHPVAAQGFNLGLRDVAAFSDLVESSRDLGSPRLLDEYVKRRSRDRNAVTDMTHFIVKTFSSRMVGLMQARHLGLVSLELIPAVRRRVIRQHLGYLGMPSAK